MQETSDNMNDLGTKFSNTSFYVMIPAKTVN